MYFTQEDYKKIENWLHRNSVKDTEFQEALPFTGKEIVTIVQDGHNRKVNIQEFINQLYKHGVEDFLNVTNTYGANNITLKEAIRLIPAEARKEGQVITFLNTDGNWEIYQFIGKLNQWNNPTLWNNPFDWEKLVVDSILPDEEDLTKSASDAKGNSYLSLKDRKYEPDKYSGLGRKILRRRVVEIEDPVYGTQEKNLLLQADFAEDNTVYVVRYDFTLNGQDITLPDNSYIEYEGGSISDGNIIDRAGGLNRVVLKKNIVNGKNILTQEMVSKSNTIYEIRYDFDLNGQEITIPEGCVLDFQGGSINNGTIIGNNTILNANSLFLLNNIKGTFSTIDVKLHNNIETEDTFIIATDNFHLDLNGYTIKCKRIDNTVQNTLFYAINIKNIYINNGILDGGLNGAVGGAIQKQNNFIHFENCKNINISHVNIINTGGCFTSGSATEYCSVLIEDSSDITLTNTCFHNIMTEGLIFMRCSNIYNKGFKVTNDEGTYTWTSLHYWYCDNIVTENAYIHVRDDAGSGITGYVKNAIYDNITIIGGCGIQTYNEGEQDNLFAEENIILNNCRLYCSSFGYQQYVGSQKMPKCSNIRILNCEFNMKHASGTTGTTAIRVGNCDNLYIKNNIINYEDVAETKSSVGIGLLFTINCKNINISNNIINSCKNIGFNGTSSNITIEDVIIKNNIFKCCSSNITRNNNSIYVYYCGFNNLTIADNKFPLEDISIEATDSNISKNIYLTNNTFGNFDTINGTPFRLFNCTNLYIERNKFFDTKSSIHLNKITNIFILNNSYIYSKEGETSTDNLLIGNSDGYFYCIQNYTNKKRWTYSFIRENTCNFSEKFTENNSLCLGMSDSVIGSIRPNLASQRQGTIFFDTTINKPIWWTGTKWIDATGADV